MKAIVRAGLAVSLVQFTALSVAANASILAVVDSGVDYKHPALASRMWNNPGEIPGNGLDDDGDAFIDDVFGWNFAENNNGVIDYKYLGRFTGEHTKFFDVQKKILEGSATDEDKAWVKAKVADKAFLKELQVFGNFVHGTHVAGITAGENPTARIMALKLLPTATNNSLMG